MSTKIQLLHECVLKEIFFLCVRFLYRSLNNVPIQRQTLVIMVKDVKSENLF